MGTPTATGDMDPVAPHTFVKIHGGDWTFWKHIKSTLYQSPSVKIITSKRLLVLRSASEVLLMAMAMLIQGTIIAHFQLNENQTYCLWTIKTNLSYSCYILRLLWISPFILCHYLVKTFSGITHFFNPLTLLHLPLYHQMCYNLRPCPWIYQSLHMQWNGRPLHKHRNSRKEAILDTMWGEGHWSALWKACSTWWLEPYICFYFYF